MGDEAAERLRQAVANVLNRAIERRGSSIRDYVGGSGLAGEFQNEFAPTAAPANRAALHGLIERMRLAGRPRIFAPRARKADSFE